MDAFADPTLTRRESGPSDEGLPGCLISRRLKGGRAMGDAVLTERSGGVLEIVLNRPERRNALNLESLDGLSAALGTAADTADVRVVLIRGAGGAFCSGIDLKSAGTPMDPEWMRAYGKGWGGVHRQIAALDKPVIIALERAAVNAGAALALSGDLVVAGREAFLQVGEVERDMVAPINIAWLCARYGSARALDLTLTGRRLPGPELYRLGMALECVDDAEVVEAARALAARVAGFPPGGVTGTKRMIRAVEAATGGDPASNLETVRR